MHRMFTKIPKTPLERSIESIVILLRVRFRSTIEKEGSRAAFDPRKAES